MGFSDVPQGLECVWGSDLSYSKYSVSVKVTEIGLINYMGERLRNETIYSLEEEKVCRFFSAVKRSLYS